MALIACPECSHTVSDRAAACPACAYPIHAAEPDPLQQLAAVHRPAYAVPTGRPRVVTTERTAKRWKAQLLLSGTLAGIGVCVLFLTEPLAHEIPRAAGVPTGDVRDLVLLGGGAGLAVGLVWYGFARCLAWWHHG